MTDQAGFDDREHLEAQLIDMHRLEGLGLLVGRIAHDFNNLLAVIGMNAEMVRSNVDDDSPLQARFDQIEEATRRAATLTLQMSRYCRGAGPGRGTLDVTRTIDDIAALLRVGIGDGTTLELDLADHPLLIEGNATEIQQVVVDLVLNGSEAIGRARGTVTVRARPTEPRRPPVETGDAGGASGAQRVDETGEAGGTGEEVLIEVSDDPTRGSSRALPGRLHDQGARPRAGPRRGARHRRRPPRDDRGRLRGGTRYEGQRPLPRRIHPTDDHGTIDDLIG